MSDGTTGPTPELPAAFQANPTVPAPYAPYTPAPYPPAGFAYTYVYETRTNGLAIASIVLSLVAFLTAVSAVGGVVTGHIALSQIKRTGENGRGLAIAGLAIGYVFVALGALWLAFVIMWIATPSSGGWL